jgi:hypothetical protein
VVPVLCRKVLQDVEELKSLSSLRLGGLLVMLNGEDVSGHKPETVLALDCYL